MSYSDVKQFCFQYLEDLSVKFHGKSYEGTKEKGLKKSEYDDDEIAIQVAKMLASKPNQTKILVIDEIDAFEAHQYGFLALTKQILSSKTNTIIIGIANSVDLPFKKKNSAIAMRDA